MPEIPGRPKQVEVPRVWVETYESQKAAEERAAQAAEASKHTTKKEAH